MLKLKLFILNFTVLLFLKRQTRLYVAIKKEHSCVPFLLCFFRMLLRSLGAQYKGRVRHLIYYVAVVTKQIIATFVKPIVQIRQVFFHCSKGSDVVG